MFRLNQIFALRDWLKTVPKPKPATEVAEEKEEKTDKRKMLMQNMAQLWLQQEVNITYIKKDKDTKIINQYTCTSEYGNTTSKWFKNCVQGQ